ncbi:hypothetical protein [Methylobacterium sp. R2-1]|uniref:hypothetical protein n=1 Tax=Methylobacterium sp. R2-1 TaxID=2587064 RepID=UPI0016109A11|nr:hypothetical protein [Methylobacterium sp. R2-1]MBB2961929.1 hypothetical protein [Methylobacterium sp. R2-1]
MPLTPADMFAAASHLLDASGAYQYIVAPFSSATGASAGLAYAEPTFAPTDADLRHWCMLGNRWAVDMSAATEIQLLWDRLVDSGSADLVVSPKIGDAPPSWWKVCHALLVIADEASSELGYDPEAAPVNGAKWANHFASATLKAATGLRVIENPAYQGDGRHLSRHVALDSLCTSAVERHVARVLPKGRTTEIGCTLRTFSHNLTLLPPHGQANAYWHQGRGRSAASDPNSLNIMLLPFPYIVPADCFRGGECGGVSGPDRWGRFAVDQRWLGPGSTAAPPAGASPGWSTPASRRSFVAFVEKLVDEAESDGPVHGIVLPELALDWETYDALVRHLRDTRPNVEFVVSGVSMDCNGRAGNLVTTTMIFEKNGERIAETHSRGKHHRWQVEKSQIDSYDVGAELDRAAVWWEHLPIGERVLHVDVLRENSTLTAVICEDLARVEPGLTLLRALGPSLVFALLMDGPQLKSRWPGVYATGLADDPGSSVLSMTSAGMVSRSNEAYGKLCGKPPSPDRVVAYWKNRPAGGPPSVTRHEMQIGLPKDKQAVVLSLVGCPATESTMDARRNSDALAWYLEDKRDVGLSSGQVAAGGWEWIAPIP